MDGLVMISVLAGTAVFFALHIALWRFAPSSAPRMPLLGGLVGCGFVTSGFVHGWLAGSVGAPSCAAMSGTLLMLMAYVFFYAGIVRSVSVLLLIRLLRLGGRPMALEELQAWYRGTLQFEDRIRLMHRSGLVQLSGQAVTLTARGERLARQTFLLSRVLTGGLQG